MDAAHTREPGAAGRGSRGAHAGDRHRSGWGGCKAAWAGPPILPARMLAVLTGIRGVPVCLCVQAIAQRLAAVQEQEPSAPASPEGSAGAAAAIQELPSRSSSSGDERGASTTGRMSASGAAAAAVDALPAFPSASTPGGAATAPDVSAADRTPSPFNTAKAARARAQRPGLADIFVSACDQVGAHAAGLCVLVSYGRITACARADRMATSLQNEF